MADASESKDRLVQRSLEKFVYAELILPTLYSPFEQLDNFLWETRHLFTLIGVFGAVTIYLRDLGQQAGAQLQIPVGPIAISGFSIVLLLSVLVLAKLVKRTRDLEGRVSQVGLWLFGITFFPLVLIVMEAIMQFPEIWGNIFTFFAFVGGIFLPFGLLLILVSASNYFGERIGRNGSIFFVSSLVIIVIVVSYLAGKYPSVFQSVSDVAQSGPISVAEFGKVLIATMFSMTVFLFLGGTRATHYYDADWGCPRRHYNCAICY
ncbi:MAG: hypothetical protein ABEH58_02605 [Haloplanus sp.]